MEDCAAACFDGSSTAVSDDGTDDEHNTATSQQLNQQPGTLFHTEVELSIINRETNQEHEAEQKDGDPHLRITTARLLSLLPAGPTTRPRGRGPCSLAPWP